MRRRLGEEETVLIALRGPLEWIGEMALLEDAGRSASTLAQDDVRALEVPREAFLAVGYAYPHTVDPLVRSYRELITRAEPMQREVQMMRGLARQMMWQMLGASHPMEAHRLDSAAMNYMGARGDSQEGIQSFLEKRAPAFPLRVSADFPEDLGFPPEPAYEP